MSRKFEFVDLDILIVPGPSKIKVNDQEEWEGGIDFVKYQIKNFEELNPSVNFRWNIGIIEGQINPSTYPHDSDKIRNFVFKSSDLGVKYVDNPSSQHGAILTLLVSKLLNNHSRFILIIDPDFFVITKFWVKNLITHMLSNSIAILGASYPENDCRLYFDFPTAYFSIIDTSLIRLENLDYRPDENEMIDSELTAWKSDFKINMLPYKLYTSSNFFMSRIKRLFQSIFSWRSKKSFLRDTGWGVRLKYKNKIKHEEFLYLDDLKYELVNYENQPSTSGVDSKYYLEKYKDVAESGMDPIAHFKNHGLAEWRQPRPLLGRSEKQYVHYLRPHLKSRVFKHFELLFNSEHSIQHNRTYTFDDLMSELKNEDIEALIKLPKTKGFYFFKDRFIAYHLGHGNEIRSIKQIDLMNKEFFINSDTND